MPIRRALSAPAVSADPFALDALEPRALLAATFNGIPIPAQLPGVNVGAVQSIAAADFDGDGATDLAVSFRDATSGTIAPGIAFYRGQDNGTFLAPVFTRLGSRAGELAPFATAPGIAPPLGGGSELLSVAGVGGNDSNGFTRAFVRVLRLNVFSGQFSVQARMNVDPIDGVGRPIFPGAPLTHEFTGDNRVDIAFALTTYSGSGIAIVERPQLSTLRLNTRLYTPAVWNIIPPIDGISENPLIAADMSSDGRMELIYRSQSGLIAFRNLVGGIVSSYVSLGLASNLDWRFTDVNGDGRADALSTWTPLGQIANDVTNTFSHLRVRLGQGFSIITGLPIFSPLVRVASFSRGPALPFGVIGAGSNATNREVFFPVADLDADGLTDFFYFRAYTGENALGPFAYERASALAAPNPPTALPLLWPPPIESITPVAQQNILGDFNNVFGAGLPVFADLNNDGRADLIQSVNGRIEVRLNV